MSRVLFLLVFFAVVGIVQTRRACADDDAPKKTLFLPKSPVAAAYMLARLSNKELIEAPRSEFVYVALLQRQGLERKYRLAVTSGLTRSASPPSVHA